MIRSYLKSSLLAVVWFVFLTFPFMVVKVNTLNNTVEWRWLNILWVAIGAFFLSALWRWAMERRDRGASEYEGEDDAPKQRLGQRIMEDRKIYRPILAVLAVVVILFPLVFDAYQVSIMVLALIFVVLGLGLNITVGLAGLLDLGYVAFFAVGAYTYGLLSFY
jgi:branched-chain amino acid transport system permease protein